MQSCAGKSLVSTSPQKNKHEHRVTMREQVPEAELSKIQQQIAKMTRPLRIQHRNQQKAKSYKRIVSISVLRALPAANTS